MSVRKAFKPGDEIVLGQHDHRDNWNDSMDQYVGKTTKLTRMVGNDSHGFVTWQVEIDDGVWHWREDNMKQAEDLRKYKDECPCGIHPSVCDYHNF